MLVTVHRLGRAASLWGSHSRITATRCRRVVTYIHSHACMHMFVLMSDLDVKVSSRRLSML